jgi:hypothetical protein
MARKSGLGFFGVVRQSARRDHQAFNATLGQVIPAREHPHLMEQAAEERAARPAPKSHSSHRHYDPRSSASLGETRPADENFGRGM